MAEPLALLSTALARRGVDLASYQPAFVLRRLRRRAMEKNEPFVDQLVERMLGAEAELDTFVDDLSVVVSSFFRDASAFALLEERVIPWLPRQLRAWSAGCAIGQEAGSLAMLMAEAGRDYQVIGTDRSAPLIERARRGAYFETEVEDLTLKRLRTHLEKTSDGFALSPAVLERLRYETHDLTSPTLPGAIAPGSLDLVTCRNVLIYFSDSARSRAFEHFARALRPQGFLLLGGADDPPPAQLFRPVDAAQRLYAQEAIL